MNLGINIRHMMITCLATKPSISEEGARMLTPSVVVKSLFSYNANGTDRECIINIMFFTSPVGPHASLAVEHEPRHYLHFASEDITVSCRNCLSVSGRHYLPVSWSKYLALQLLSYLCRRSLCSSCKTSSSMWSIDSWNREEGHSCVCVWERH